MTLTAEPGVEVALLDTAGNILAVAVTATEATVTRQIEKDDYFVRVRDKEGNANRTPYRLLPAFVEAPRLRGNASLTVVVVRGDSGGKVITLTDIIEDPAGGRLTFSIQTTDFPDALGVVLSNQNLRLVAKENAASSYPVTVTATNDQGVSREFRFEAKVRSLPRWKEGVSPPPIVAVNASGGRTTVVLADYVEDPDDGPLEFSDPRGQLPAGVTAALTGSSLVIAAQPGATAGRHTLAVTATNVDGLSADFSFEVIVEPFPERIQNGPSLPTLVVGGETTIRLTDYIEDPLGGTLTFTHGPLPGGFRVMRNGPEWMIAVQSNVAPGDYDFVVTATTANGLSMDIVFKLVVEKLHGNLRRAENVDCHIWFRTLTNLAIYIHCGFYDPQCGPLSAGNTAPWPFSYEGDCSGRRAHGRGTVVRLNTGHGVELPNGRRVTIIESRYEGEFLDGRATGQGIRTDTYATDYGNRFPNTPSANTHFEGEFLDGRLHGQGRATFINTEMYEGGFWHGQRWGHGTQTNSHGTRWDGEWANDRFVSGTIARPDGTVCTVRIGEETICQRTR